MLFIDLRDHYGITQCVIENNNNFFPILEKSKQESVLKITGKVVKRSSGTENKDLITGNDFRQIALVKNIKDNSGVTYTSNTGTGCHIVNVASGQLANYAVDDIIVSNDGGKFQVIQLDSDNNNIYLTAEIPLISNSSTLENTTQSIASLSINSVTNPEIDNSTGEIVYLDNRAPIIRSADQVEQVKALIRF